MNELSFRNPEYLWLFLLIPVLIVLKYKLNRPSAVQFPSISVIKSIVKQKNTNSRKIFLFLRLIVISLIIISIARPQIGKGVSEKLSSGIDIILALDISSSMLALDFSQEKHLTTRIDAAKSAIKEFIEKRPNDRIGLIAFAKYPYLVSPLTLNHSWLLKNLDRLAPGLVEDGTAIGSAIAMSVNRLRNLTSKSKIIVLLTDGVNNFGSISPLIAAESALTFQTKIYTIAAGLGGIVPTLYLNQTGNIAKNIFGDPDILKTQIPVDETTLQEIATKTGGKFFKATSLKELKNVYKEIDLLEKSKVKLKQFSIYRDIFSIFVVLALILLCFEQILKNTYFRRIP